MKKPVTKKFVHPARLPRKKKGSDGTAKQKAADKKADPEGSGETAEQESASDSKQPAE